MHRACLTKGETSPIVSGIMPVRAYQGGDKLGLV